MISRKVCFSSLSIAYLFVRVSALHWHDTGPDAKDKMAASAADDDADAKSPDAVWFVPLEHVMAFPNRK